MTIEQRDILVMLLKHAKEVGIDDVVDGAFGDLDINPEDLDVVEKKLQDIINLIEI